MINRFKVKVNDTVKQFRELEEATFYIDKFEKLGYDCKLYFSTIGLYEEHTYLIYSTLQKSQIKENLKKLGIAI